MPKNAEAGVATGGPRTLPEGFTLKLVSTDCSGHKYEVEVPQADSLQAILDAYATLGKNGDEILLAIWNSGNAQGGKQGQKNLVRKALETEDGDVDAAVAQHQDVARQFIQGAPRGGGGPRHESGLTKKEREAFGGAVAIDMGKTGAPPDNARMREIAEGLGIDPDALGLNG